MSLRRLGKGDPAVNGRELMTPPGVGWGGGRAGLQQKSRRGCPGQAGCPSSGGRNVSSIQAVQWLGTSWTRPVLVPDRGGGEAGGGQGVVRGAFPPLLSLASPASPSERTAHGAAVLRPSGKRGLELETGPHCFRGPRSLLSTVPDAGWPACQHRTASPGTQAVSGSQP